MTDPFGGEEFHAPGHLVHEAGELPGGEAVAAAVQISVVPLGPRVAQETLKFSQRHVLHDHEHRVCKKITHQNHKLVQLLSAYLMERHVVEFSARLFSSTPGNIWLTACKRFGEKQQRATMRGNSI
jgi:hypothetical protein